MKCPRCDTPIPIDPGAIFYCGKPKDCYFMSTQTPRDPLLVEREKTHGSFLVNAEVFQALWAATPVQGLQLLTVDQHLALVMIYVKLARVLSNPKTKDSWDDIAGYAKLIYERL